MDTHAGEHPRIGAVDVIPFIPLAATTMADCIELARAFGARIAARFDAARLPLRQRRHAARSGSSWPTSGAASTRGCETRSPNTAASPTSVRRGSIRRPALSPSGARPFLIAYNINLASEDVDLAKRIARRVRESGGGLPETPGERLLDRGAAPRAGLDEPARFHGHAALARLGDGSRGGGRRWRRSCRVGVDRASPAGIIPGGRGSGGRCVGRRRSKTAWRSPPPTFACATSRRCRRLNSASRRHARRHLTPAAAATPGDGPAT